MIAPLRRRHRWMVVALGALVPVGFALGIAARPDFPGAPAEVPAGWEGLEPLGELPLRVRVGPDSLELVPTADPRRPDVLVYLTTRTGPFEALPPDAELIGGLSGLRPRSFRLADGAEGRSLVLFSLGHQQVLGSAPLPAQE